ncbi:MAG: carbohydrate kinase family protein [Patescibacteria group bacterium]
MNKIKVITIGGATRDIIFVTKEGKLILTPEDLTSQKLLAFESGAKILSENSIFATGGGGCNVAVGLRRLGIPVAAHVTIGTDNKGESVIASLKREFVDTKLVVQNDKDSTGFSFLLVSATKKDHIAFLYRGMNNRMQVDVAKIKKLKPRWLYVSSLTGQTWRSNMKKIRSLVKGETVRLMWNPGSTQLSTGYNGLRTLLKLTDVLLLNKDEAIELVLSKSKKVKNINSAANLAKIIKSWGPRIVIITAGRKGAYAYDGDKIYYQPIIRSKVVDTTGAGDCTGASFLAGYINLGGDIQKALKIGAFNTSRLVRELGAQHGLIERSDLPKELLK